MFNYDELSEQLELKLDTMMLGLSLPEHIRRTIKTSRASSLFLSNSDLLHALAYDLQSLSLLPGDIDDDSARPESEGPSAPDSTSSKPRAFNTKTTRIDIQTGLQTTVEPMYSDSGHLLVLESQAGNIALSLPNPFALWWWVGRLKRAVANARGDRVQHLTGCSSDREEDAFLARDVIPQYRIATIVCVAALPGESPSAVPLISNRCVLSLQSAELIYYDPDPLKRVAFANVALVTALHISHDLPAHLDQELALTLLSGSLPASISSPNSEVKVMVKVPLMAAVSSTWMKAKAANNWNEKISGIFLPTPQPEQQSVSQRLDGTMTAAALRKHAWENVVVSAVVTRSESSDGAMRLDKRISVDTFLAKNGAAPGAPTDITLALTDAVSYDVTLVSGSGIVCPVCSKPEKSVVVHCNFAWYNGTSDSMTPRAERRYKPLASDAPMELVDLTWDAEFSLPALGASSRAEYVYLELNERSTRTFIGRVFMPLSIFRTAETVRSFPVVPHDTFPSSQRLSLGQVTVRIKLSVRQQLSPPLELRMRADVRPVHARTTWWPSRASLYSSLSSTETESAMERCSVVVNLEGLTLRCPRPTVSPPSPQEEESTQCTDHSDGNESDTSESPIRERPRSRSIVRQLSGNLMRAAGLRASSERPRSNSCPPNRTQSRRPPRNQRSDSSPDETVGSKKARVDTTPMGGGAEKGKWTRQELMVLVEQSALQTCRERVDMDSNVVIPWSQVSEVVAVTPAVLFLSFKFHRYAGKDENGDEIFAEDWMTLFVESCPSEELEAIARLSRDIAEQRERVRDLLLGSETEPRRGLETALRGAVVDMYNKSISWMNMAGDIHPGQENADRSGAIAGNTERCAGWGSADPEVEKDRLLLSATWLHLYISSVLMKHPNLTAVGDLDLFSSDVLVSYTSLDSNNSSGSAHTSSPMILCRNAKIRFDLLMKDLEDRLLSMALAVDINEMSVHRRDVEKIVDDYYSGLCLVLGGLYDDTKELTEIQVCCHRSALRFLVVCVHS